ncbi:MAG: hypothetical protein IH840_04845 [Candidatus Heimdallarchaeota archaeon]|nr:hypothetical protein [Candidatus Heimdallarchaeota archaeon]
MPLRSKLKVLQDSVTQFGTDGSIPVAVKQQAIMELHPELMMLTNDMIGYGEEFSTLSSICLNFLLNHLSSTAAADPKSRVIGVSNVMAQVLSSGTQIVPYEEFKIEEEDPKYFDEFARYFNNMLTTAGLFAAPVLGLPDIPISTLGQWADQALNQFANINKFLQESFNPGVFYRIEKKVNAQIFDATTDIMEFYLYENEFLAALIARSDILSGLEFKRTADGRPVTLQSSEEITLELTKAIVENCNQIENGLGILESLYKEGKIDRNENPFNHPVLQNYRIEAQLWKIIAELANELVDIFKTKLSIDPDIKRSGFLNIGNNSEKPVLDVPSEQNQNDLYSILNSFEEYLFKLFPQASSKTNFIESSDFIKFNSFLDYILMIVAANDILLNSKNPWIGWFADKYSGYLEGSATKTNPLGSIKFAILLIIDGVMLNNHKLSERGLEILKESKPYLEFQLHHLIAVQVLEILISNPYSEYKNLVDVLTNALMKILTDYEVSPDSILFQRTNMYVGMLAMYKESPEGEFLRKANERSVAFDLFSWLQVPRTFKPDFPYMPLNTSLDNLSAG